MTPSERQGTGGNPDFGQRRGHVRTPTGPVGVVLTSEPICLQVLSSPTQTGVPVDRGHPSGRDRGSSSVESESVPSPGSRPGPEPRGLQTSTRVLVGYSISDDSGLLWTPRRRPTIKESC